MRKRKVLWFFALFFLFAGILTYIEVQRFGSLTGFFTLNESSYEQGLSKSSYSFFEKSAFLLALFFFIVFAVKFIFNYYVRNDNIHAERHERKKLIPLDLSKLKDNF